MPDLSYNDIRLQNEVRMLLNDEGAPVRVIVQGFDADIRPGAEGAVTLHPVRDFREVLDLKDEEASLAQAFMRALWSMVRKSRGL